MKTLKQFQTNLITADIETSYAINYHLLMISRVSVAGFMPIKYTIETKDLYFLRDAHRFASVYKTVAGLSSNSAQGSTFVSTYCIDFTPLSKETVNSEDT